MAKVPQEAQIFTYFPSDEIPTILLRSSGLPISKGGFEASKDKRLLNGSQIP